MQPESVVYKLTKVPEEKEICEHTPDLPLPHDELGIEVYIVGGDDLRKAAAAGRYHLCEA
jgi:hypothetical protein